MRPNETKPNILVFCTDEQRGDYLGCRGHPHQKTPNIDRIAADGTLFANCYSSNPVCMPARATMLTGLTSRVHGVVENGIDLDKSIPTLPGVLADAGYRTHAVGKLHFAGRGGRDIAPDEDVSECPERRIYWDWPNHWQGACYKKFPDNYYGFQTVELAQGHVNYIYGDYVTWLEEHHPGAYAGYRCSNADPQPLAIDPELHYNTWIADRSIDFIRRCAGPGVRSPAGGAGPGTDRRARNTDAAPWFLWCSFPDPHEPFAAVKTWSDAYDDVEIELARNQLELSPDSRSETMTRLGLGTRPLDPTLVKKSIRQTYGMISHVDEQVGRVLDTLDELGVADNTVVMFISDHGDQLGEHGLFYKGIYPYDAHAHIPFLAKVPWAARKGRVVEDVVSMLDMVPTLLDLAGVPYPCGRRRDDGGTPTYSELPGEVLTAVLTGDAAPVRGNALVEADRRNTQLGVVQMRTLVTNDYKLVFYAPTREVMLFDRRRDPQELKNLADDPACRHVVNAMMKDLLHELSRTEMPQPRRWGGVASGRRGTVTLNDLETAARRPRCLSTTISWA